MTDTPPTGAFMARGKRGWPDPREMPGAFVQALKRFNNKGGWIMSSHIAMSLMLALFPFLIFVVGVAVNFAHDVPVEDLIELIFATWPDEIADPIETEIRSVLTGAGSRLMTISGLLAVYFASNGVDAVRVAVTLAYHDTDPRSFLQARVLCIVLVLCGAVAVVAIAVLGIILPVTFDLLENALPDKVAQWAELVRPTAVLTGVLTTVVPILTVTVVHLVLPGGRHPLRHVLPGIVLTVVLWALCSWGFSYYMSEFATYAATYAGLAGAMAGLIFLYLIGAILILGAEFNGAILYPGNGDTPKTGAG